MRRFVLWCLGLAFCAFVWLPADATPLEIYRITWTGSGSCTTRTFEGISPQSVGEGMAAYWNQCNRGDVAGNCASGAANKRVAEWEYLDFTPTGTGANVRVTENSIGYAAWSCNQSLGSTITSYAVPKVTIDVTCTPGGVASSGFYEIGSNPNNRPLLLACENYCETIFDGISPAGSYSAAGLRQWFAQGSYLYTGNACTSSNGTPLGAAEAPANTCPAGQVGGYVNEEWRCIKQSDGEEDRAPEKKSTSESTTTTETLPNGNTKTTTKTTKCDADGDCTETTETTETTPGGQEVSRSSSTVQTAGNGTPGVEDDQKPDEEQKSECELSPDSAGCQELGDAPEPDAIPGVERPISAIVPQGGWGADTAACPAPVTVSMQGQTIAIPFDLFCTYMGGIRFAVLAWAWISAAFIFVGRSGD